MLFTTSYFILSSSSSSLKLLNLVRVCFVLFSMFFLFSINIYLKSPKKLLQINTKYTTLHSNSKLKTTSSPTPATTNTSKIAIRRLDTAIKTFNDCNFLNDSSLYDNRSICDLLITIKSTRRNHDKKLKAIIDTWFNLVPSKVN